MKVKTKDIIIPAILTIAIVGYIFWLQAQPDGTLITTANSNCTIELKQQMLFGQSATITGSKTQSLRAGTYRPASIGILAKDTKHPTFLYSTEPLGDLESIVILPGNTTSISFGTPLTVKPLVRQSGRFLSVDYRITGIGGESYHALTTKNQPKVEILNEEGKTLTTGNFEYG